MTLIVCDPQIEKRLIARRRRLGHDRYDEVWDGVYVMSPEANIEHQVLAADLYAALKQILPRDFGLARPSINVSDRVKGWKKNFRVPDASVYLAGNPAQDLGTHYCGGPDWTMEVLSPGDRTREKFEFYAKIGVRELLIVGRDPWTLELYALKRKKLKFVGKNTVESTTPLASTVLPLTFRLVPGDPRPLLELGEPGGKTLARL